MLGRITHNVSRAWLLSLLVIACNGYTQVEQPVQSQEQETTQQIADSSTGTSEATVAAEVEQDVQGATDDAVAEKRRQLLDEAIAALRESETALEALDEGDTEAALEALAIVAGKLQIVVGREPSLALAPVDVSVTRRDILAGDPDTIRAMREEIEEVMEDGSIQEARLMLRDFGSELVIEVLNIPLETYPAAIRRVAGLIDDGETAAAKAALTRALNTLIVTESIIALPVLRAESMLEQAQALANKDEPTDEEHKQLAELLADVETELALTEAFGYAEETRSYDALMADLRKLRKKADSGEDTRELFGAIRERFGTWRNQGSD